MQCAKKVVCDSPGLVEFATGLMNSVLNTPDGPAGKVFWGIHSNQSCSSKKNFQAIESDS